MYNQFPLIPTIHTIYAICTIHTNYLQKVLLNTRSRFGDDDHYVKINYQNSFPVKIKTEFFEMNPKSFLKT